MIGMNTVETIGNWEWKLEESVNAPFFNLTIKNTLENKTVLVSDVVWATGREDFLEDVYNAATKSLKEEDPCCYKDKVLLIEGNI
jgi:hypothetical protein